MPLALEFKIFCNHLSFVFPWLHAESLTVVNSVSLLVLWNSVPAHMRFEGVICLRSTSPCLASVLFQKVQGGEWESDSLLIHPKTTTPKTKWEWILKKLLFHPCQIVITPWEKLLQMSIRQGLWFSIEPRTIKLPGVFVSGSLCSVLHAKMIHPSLIFFNPWNTDRRMHTCYLLSNLFF